jgi:hypothetical protein
MAAAAGQTGLVVFANVARRCETSASHSAEAVATRLKKRMQQLAVARPVGPSLYRHVF